MRGHEIKITTLERWRDSLQTIERISSNTDPADEDEVRSAMNTIRSIASEILDKLPPEVQL